MERLATRHKVGLAFSLRRGPVGCLEFYETVGARVGAVRARYPLQA
jgi:hypothetical protein